LEDSLAGTKTHLTGKTQVIFNFKRYKNDVYELDVKENVWTRRECNGKIPSGRCGHSVNIHKSTLYLFGGYTCKEFGKTSYDNNLYKLNLKTWTWTHITLKGKIPGRYQHTSVFDYKTTSLLISKWKLIDIL
jgi:leucine-zipper-like transcriptional regulator 1